MTDRLTLRWLATADDAAIKANVDGTAAVVVGFRKRGPGADVTWITPAVQRILQLCADTGSGSFPADQARRLLLPILLYLKDAGRTDEFAPELAAVARRSDIRASKALDDHLAPFALNHMEGGSEMSSAAGCPPDQRSEGSAATVGSELVAGLAIGDVPSVSAAPGVEEFLTAVHQWQAVRARSAADVRAASDVWLLRVSMLRRLALPVPYVESLVDDDSFWGSGAAIAFAEALVEPFNREAVGRVQSALLNSRLRQMRPRLFLRAPESLVIEPIGARLDVSRIEEELTNEVSAPLLRAIATIEAENTRAASRPPRKRVFKELGGYLEQVLERLGSAVEGRVNAPDSFDPARHVAAEAIATGADVEIVVPGLRDRRTKHVRIKALVQPVLPVQAEGHDEGVEAEKASRTVDAERSAQGELGHAVNPIPGKQEPTETEAGKA
jgi:hypothetical protein